MLGVVVVWECCCWCCTELLVDIPVLARCMVLVLVLVLVLALVLVLVEVLLPLLSVLPDLDRLLVEPFVDVIECRFLCVLCEVFACDQDKESISKEVLMTSFTSVLFSAISRCRLSVFKGGGRKSSPLDG